MTAADPRYVAARRALLDALEALQGHAEAIVVAGAQAIYLHTGSGDLALSPYTTDGDLALHPEKLSADPTLEAAMRAAGFELMLQGGNVEPGIWVTEKRVHGQTVVVPVDLIVPAGVAPTAGRRGARLGPHGSRAARKIAGLEAAIVDHSPMTIKALEPQDERSRIANVAGPAALFVAKAHKLHDRLNAGRPNRVDDKDAADIFRLMQTTQALDVGATLAMLTYDELAGPATTASLTYMEELFARRGRPGVRMATRALRTAVPESRVEAICVAYATALLNTAR